MTMEPMTPIAADSVGVATPAIAVKTFGDSDKKKIVVAQNARVDIGESFTCLKEGVPLLISADQYMESALQSQEKSTIMGNALLTRGKCRSRGHCTCNSPITNNG